MAELKNSSYVREKRRACSPYGPRNPAALAVGLRVFRKAQIESGSGGEDLVYQAVRIKTLAAAVNGGHYLQTRHNSATVVHIF